MRLFAKKSLDLYILTALAKGFPVFCSVLLPVLYAQHLIDAKALGYIGALFIVFTIIGAIVVAKRLHNLDTRQLLQLAAFGTIGASSLLFVAMITQNIPMLALAYAIIGIAAGAALSGVNAMSAHATTRGNRFKVIARLSMVADVVRIIFSLIVAGLVLIGASWAAVLLIVASGFVFLFYASRQETIKSQVATKTSFKGMRHNTPFKFILSLEFLDSFSSSQLFVFLPLLFMAKGYSLENSILLQACTFLGYMSGRWLIGVLAQRSSGLKAVGLAEAGLVTSILLLLVVEPLWALYILSFALGIFARGTSPAIKSLAFDSLEDSQMKQGSALHVIVGDGGSAIGQLAFGLLVAGYGVEMPFIVAGSIAAIITVLCLSRLGRLIISSTSQQTPVPQEG